MLEAMVEALGVIFSWDRLLWLFAGTCLGLFMGLVPGLGGMVGMALLLPFVYGMDPYSGIALLIGMMAVVQLGDTFPAVLLGIPGTVGGQATIMDGYPMARQGKRPCARRGVLGVDAGWPHRRDGPARLLPIARPLVLAVGSPELLMFTLLGLSLVAVLSRGRPLRGIMMGLLGMPAEFGGSRQASTDIRFTFDLPYLYGGISLIIVALAIFAVPELIDLSLRTSGSRRVLRRWRRA